MGSLGPTEIILIILVIVLLFGAKKLPELARGSGRALRIFKAETKGLVDDDEDTTTNPTTASAIDELSMQPRLLSPDSGERHGTAVANRSFRK